MVPGAGHHGVNSIICKPKQPLSTLQRIPKPFDLKAFSTNLHRPPQNRPVAASTPVHARRAAAGCTGSGLRGAREVPGSAKVYGFIDFSVGPGGGPQSCGLVARGVRMNRSARWASLLSEFSFSRARESFVLRVRET